MLATLAALSVKYKAIITRDIKTLLTLSGSALNAILSFIIIYANAPNKIAASTPDDNSCIAPLVSADFLAIFPS